MKIITRYLFKEFLIFFSVSLIAFLVVYLVIEFFGKIDNFLEAQVPIHVALSFFAYQVPMVIKQIIPVSVLISIMLMLGLMNKHNEILALRNSGLNIFNLSAPLILISFFIGIVSFFLSESIVPVTNSKANQIWNSRVEKRNQKGTYKLSHIWYKDQNSIYKVRTYDRRKKRAEGLTVFFFDKNYRLVKRIDAKEADWHQGKWLLRDTLVQYMNPGTPRVSNRFDTYNIVLPETPENFERTMKSPEEMSFWELRDYTRKIQKEGYDSTVCRVELYIKTSFPFISLVLTLVGIPLALGKKRGGIPFSITIGIGICFIYLLTFGVSRSLALSEALPAILGAWLANLLFSMFGFFLMLKEEGG